MIERQSATCQMKEIFESGLYFACGWSSIYYATDEQTTWYLIDRSFYKDNIAYLQLWNDAQGMSA